MDARMPGEELQGPLRRRNSGRALLRPRRHKAKARDKVQDGGRGRPLPAIQLAILRGLAACVKPGGTLLYSTCTLLERENEDVVRAFLAENEGFTAAEERTLWPDIDKTDGFFICRMVKSI